MEEIADSKENMNNVPDFVSGCCIGEKCSICGKPATNKMCEEVFVDDPHPNRHGLTAYLCSEHFNMITGCNF